MFNFFDWRFIFVYFCCVPLKKPGHVRSAKWSKAGCVLDADFESFKMHHEQCPGHSEKLCEKVWKDENREYIFVICGWCLFSYKQGSWMGKRFSVRVLVCVLKCLSLFFIWVILFYVEKGTTAISLAYPMPMIFTNYIGIFSFCWFYIDRKILPRASSKCS